ncbi:MAG: hypothetical protein AB7F40_06810 [Victivallaceae bacterium]|nr:hypothetical protein [Victivallaceae bacterium]
MVYPRKVTLIELVLVLLIMVLAGSLLVGRLSHLPRFASLGNTAGRVDLLCRYASEAAVGCNRPVVVGYLPEHGELEILTDLKLDEPDYGATEALPEIKIDPDMAFSASDLPPYTRSKMLALPEGCSLELEPEAEPTEELIAEASNLDPPKRPAPEPPYPVATFYPDGSVSGRRFKLKLGNSARFAEWSHSGGALNWTDGEPLSAWREAEK